MKIVKTTWFPFGSYDAMAMFPFVFIKGDVKPVVINHEKIHIEQQKELYRLQHECLATNKDAF